MTMLPSKFSRNNVAQDYWGGLRSFTKARIGLGSTGVATPLKEVLDFKMCHAHARDAVYSVLKVGEIMGSLKQFDLPVFAVKSKAKDRIDFLQRPDHGRQLDEDSFNQLRSFNSPASDIAIAVADGLSATAINEHAVPVLDRLIPTLKKACFTISPLIIAEQARVALADEIGDLLHAKLTLILIGERPGLSSPDSMGAYLTFNPKPGSTDESRNCVSNIRPEGLSYELAAEKLFKLIQASLQLKLSGVSLKEDMLQLPR